MVIAAGRTAYEVRVHGRHRDVRPGAGQLKLDVRVEMVEALLASELRAGRAEHSAELAAGITPLLLGHGTLPIVPIPRSARAARSLRRASCKVL